MYLKNSNIFVYWSWWTHLQYEMWHERKLIFHVKHYNIDNHISFKEKSYRKRTITMQCLWSGRTCTLLSFSCQRQTNYGPTSWAQHEYKKQEKVLRDCPFLHRPSLSDYYRLNHARTAKSACGCLVMLGGQLYFVELFNHIFQFFGRLNLAMQRK